MENADLGAHELMTLIERVFQPQPVDRSLAIIIDLPDSVLGDNQRWQRRRTLAAQWVELLGHATAAHDLEVRLFAYRNVRTNNAELPAEAWQVQGRHLPDSADELAAQHQPAEAFVQVLATHRLVLAPTELSATAPLKVLAPKLGFRAATMPGFSPAMIPALRLDYTEVNRRVTLLKNLLDRADAAELELVVDGEEPCTLRLDLRHRCAHASGGLLPEPGTAGNLPSGEAYIVPYEGELPGDPSGSSGWLPVQHGDEVVRYEVVNNVAVAASGKGSAAASEAARLRAEPAYGNIAELGLGVLADFGLTPIHEVLLDEKLGLHVAFGRSDHFGGMVGPAQFSHPEAVVHQDHVYLPALQPRVHPARVDLERCDGTIHPLIRDGEYVVPELRQA